MALQKTVIQAHTFILLAVIMWGLSAPVAKNVMNQGMNGLQFVTLRIVGSVVLFWLASLFTKQERVARKDLIKLGFAGLLAIGFNQTLFTEGLNLTSPVNASIMTTMLPLLTMFFAFLFLHEPVSWKKVLGIAFGAAGAILIVLNSSQGGEVKEGNAVGDLLVIAAQVCFAFYLTLFKDVFLRYSGLTCTKWMFTFAFVFVAPFTGISFIDFRWAGHTQEFWGGVFYVVVGATFLAYLLVMAAQKILRPTVVSIYNYVQPVVACVVSVMLGLGVFGWLQALAVLLIVSGVILVTKSKSRAQQLAEKQTPS